MSNDISQQNAEIAARVARRRSIAIALILGLMVVLFYAATLVRFGSAIATKVS